MSEFSLGNTRTRAELGCKCEVVKRGAGFVLPLANMLKDCPLHGEPIRPDKDNKGIANRGPWKQTYTGKKWHPLDPRAEDVVLEDIAHALAFTCRFGGHCRTFYSVAEHSVRVSEEVERRIEAAMKDPSLTAYDERDRRTQLMCAMWGLMHDAAEAYVGDMPSPIKCLPGLAHYRLMEHVTMLSICQAFRLPDHCPPVVKEVDGALLATEARDLMGPPPTEWPPMPAPLDGVIAPWQPSVAEGKFLFRFNELVDRLREFFDGSTT